MILNAIIRQVSRFNRFFVAILIFFLYSYFEDDDENIAITGEDKTVERIYYVACSEEMWDYAPGGTDNILKEGFGLHSEAPVFLDRSFNRIGHQYKKTIYRQYTGASYNSEIPKAEWQGIVGPILKGEVGDVIVIHFWNNASRTYSMHPHGVLYDKLNEGAEYNDGFHYTVDAVDIVKPGGFHTYRWTVASGSGPAAGDPDCITWLYHSHVTPPRDISAGLVGMLITCRKGSLAKWEETKMYALYISVMDENLSWHIDENIALFTNGSVNMDDEDFQESNLMHSINGYVYGHLPGLTACPGETVHWLMSCLGTEVDIHSMAVSGHSFEYFHHRTDAIRMTVAHFISASMVAQSEGKWLLQCQVADHITAGMQGIFEVEQCNQIEEDVFEPIATRRYYIAAEETMWDYAPSGRNKYEGGSLTEQDSDSEVFFIKDSSHIGGVYKKAVFREYTDATFTQKKLNPEDDHLGYLGPVIRAEVGDQVEVVFRNLATRPYSIHPHGVRINKLNEGALYKDNQADNSDDYVQPNTQHTYTWTIPEAQGPTPDDPTCLTRMYSSFVDVVKDTYSGLVGPMLICKKGALDDSGKQKGVDREFFLFFSVTDENNSWYLQENINLAGVTSQNEDFEESNLMHGINGRLYGNLDGVSMCEGDKVAWHVFSVGTEVDLHTVIFNGDTFNIADKHRSTSDVLPGNMRTLMMKTVNKGSWGLFCATNDHYVAGTKAIYSVNTCGTSTSEDEYSVGNVVKVYLQAEEVIWNYIPYNRDKIHDEAFTGDHSEGGVFVNSGPNRIGGTYMKAVYREYTGDTFTESVIRPTEEEYLGILGPIIRVQVGDVLNIVFKNNASRLYSIRAQGLHYDNGNMEFSDVTQPSVKPGDVFSYSWNVTESSGPGPNDPDCVSSIYHSDTNPVKDVYSGLVGPLIICRKGTLRMKYGHYTRKDVKDVALYFSVMDENQSWYLEKNIQMFTTDPATVDPADSDFEESNLMHTINGYLFGNENYVKIKEGDTVDWYLLATGTEVDMHNVHFHGNDLIVYEQKQHSNDVVQLFPSSFVTTRMHAVNAGRWLYHCHVDDHISAGMMGMYDVIKTSQQSQTDPLPYPQGAGLPHPLVAIVVLSSILLTLW